MYADGIYRFILHNMKDEDDARGCSQYILKICEENHECDS